MVQLVMNNDNEVNLVKILENYFISQYNINYDIYEDLENNKALGTALYTSGYIRDLSIISLQGFINNFNAILNFYAGGGRYNDYIQYFKTLFGEDTIVIIDFNVANKIVKISLQTGLQKNQLITEGGDNLITGTGDNLVASTLFDAVTESQAIDILELIKPHGITLEITFLQP